MFRSALRQSLNSSRRLYSTSTRQQSSSYSKFIIATGLITSVTLSLQSPKLLNESKKSSPEVKESKETKPDTQTGASAETEGEAPQAYDPETGEINWDCPCLGGMAHGPCGEEFKAAFSCFVYSKDEPKGIECIDKFKDMQNCFRKYPEVYSEELRDDDDYNSQQTEKVTENVAAIKQEVGKKVDEVTSQVNGKVDEVKAFIDDEIEDAKAKTELLKKELAEAKAELDIVAQQLKEETAKQAKELLDDKKK